MATKQQAMQFISSKYTVDQVSDDMYTATFELENNRSHMVFISFNDVNILFSSPFATTADITAKQALDAVSQTILGAQIVGDRYFVRHVAPLENLDESEIEDALFLTVHLGDMLEEELVGGDVH